MQKILVFDKPITFPTVW